MKRDWNLLRKMLLDLEQKEYEGVQYFDSNLLGESSSRIDYHKILLVESGLATGSSVMMPGGNRVATVNGLSREGHDFLDLIRNQDIWAKVDEGIQKLGGLSMTTIEKIAKHRIDQDVEVGVF